MFEIFEKKRSDQTGLDELKITAAAVIVTMAIPVMVKGTSAGVAKTVAYIKDRKNKNNEE